MTRTNPAWTEEELVLALDALSRLGMASLSKDNPIILQLSDELNRLPIHPSEQRSEPFRDPDGVRRRLSYFAQLKAGAVIEGHERYKAVWATYAADRQALDQRAAEIRHKYGL